MKPRALVCEHLVRGLLEIGWHSLPDTRRIRVVTLPHVIRSEGIYWTAAIPIRRMGASGWKDARFDGLSPLKRCATEGIKVNQIGDTYFTVSTPRPDEEPSP